MIRGKSPGELPDPALAQWLDEPAHWAIKATNGLPRPQEEERHILRTMQ
jgi:hypothetical protein